MLEQARHISNISQDVCCYQRVDLRQLHLHEKRIKLVIKSEKSTLCICWALVLLKHEAVKTLNQKLVIEGLFQKIRLFRNHVLALRRLLRVQACVLRLI